MQPTFRRAILASAILSTVLGCSHSVVQQNKQPPDPLLISKKPVEGKPTSGPSQQMLSRVDPQPPILSNDDSTMIANDRSAPARLSSELVVRPGQ
jgi:hypothetical protein